MSLTATRLFSRQNTGFQYTQPNAGGTLVAGWDDTIDALSLSGKVIHAFTYDPANSGGDLIKAYTFDNPVTKLLLEGADAKQLDGAVAAMTKLYGFWVRLRRADPSTAPSGTLTVTRTAWMSAATGNKAFSDASHLSEYTAAGPYTLLTTSALTLTASATGCGLIADVLIAGGTS